MADANVDSTQQAQDAQNFDNLTSLQQGAEGGQATPGAAADAQVNTSNPGQQDNPSLYRDTKDTTNNEAN